MYAYELEPGQPYTRAGTVYRALAAGGRPSVNVSSGLEFYPGPLVEVEPFIGTVPERVETCAHCGERKPVSMLYRITERYYDWDDPNEDAQGSVMLSRLAWQCRDAADCRRVRLDMARGAQTVAETVDAAEREAGWGAIANGARGGQE